MRARDIFLDIGSDFWKRSKMEKKEIEKIIENRFFKMKVEYLNSLEEATEDTLETYIRMFMVHFQSFETLYDKDLCKFNMDEVRLALKNLKTTSMSFKSTLFYLVKNYLEWAYEEGYRNTVNDIRLLEEEEDLLEVDIKRLEKKYISMNKTLTICRVAVNSSQNNKKIKYADALMLLLIRSGFTLEEVLDMNYEEIKIDKCAVEYSNKEKGYDKYIELDKRVITFVKNAIIETGGAGSISERKKEDSARVRLINIIKTGEIKAPTSLKCYTDSQMVDDLDEILDNNGEVKVIDVQNVKRRYEPLCSNSSYTTLKNFYSKLRDVDVKKDKPGTKRGSKRTEEKRNIVKNLLATIV